MLYKLDDYDIREIKHSENIIGKCKLITIGDDTYIEPSELLGIIENLNYEVERVSDKFIEFEQNVHDNYKQISQAEQYGISDRDFI